MMIKFVKKRIDEITKVNLYDTIYRESGKQYELSTSNNVLIEIKDPVNSLVSAEYSNKYVTFDYKIDGAGMGYTLKYDVYKGSDKVVDGATLSKKGSVEQYKYYDNVFGSNNAGVIHFVPGTSPIKPGESYRIVINAIDDIDQENMLLCTVKQFHRNTLQSRCSCFYA